MPATDVAPPEGQDVVGTNTVGVRGRAKRHVDVGARALPYDLSRGLRRLAPWLAVLTIMALGAALRLPNLATNPGWDGDEGYNYNIALNLAQGRYQMFALVFAFVQHPPLFFALAAGLFHLLGPGMLPLRLLSVLFSLGTLGLLLPLAREIAGAAGGTRDSSGTSMGLLAALAYAVLPLVALQNRFGYTYNGLAFWTILALLAVLRYRRTGGRGALVLCGAATAAALTTDQEGAYLLPLLLFGLGRASVGGRLLAWGLALAGPALYVGAMLVSSRSAVLFDLTHTAGRVTGGSIPWQAATWLYALADLMRFDPLIPLGLAGVALIPAPPGRRMALLLLAGMLLIILKVRDPNPLFRTAEPLLPLVCLGLGALGSRLWAWSGRSGRSGRPGMSALRRHVDTEASTRVSTFAHLRDLHGLRILVILGAVLAVSGCVAYDAQAAATRYRTPIDGLLPRSTDDARGMAAWMNRRLHPGDLVLAMPQVSWLLHARTAEVLQAVAITGRASAFYPAGLPARRWAYDAHLDAARFLVVDAFTRAWIARNGAERGLVRRAERTWRLVYTHGEYHVYRNPAHAP